jgi:hypothetical protein
LAESTLHYLAMGSFAAQRSDLWISVLGLNKSVDGHSYQTG